MASNTWEYLITLHEDVKQSGGKTIRNVLSLKQIADSLPPVFP